MDEMDRMSLMDGVSLTGWLSLDLHQNRETSGVVYIYDAFNDVVWLGEWDDDSGYYFGRVISDEVPWTIENPGRIYGADMFQPIPDNMKKLVTGF